MKRAFQILAVVLLVLLVIGWQVSTTSNQDKANRKERATVQTPTAEDIFIEGIGYTEPKSELRRLTFKTGGLITKCKPSVGTPVQRGDVIAELDFSMVEKQLQSAQRRVDLANAKLAELAAGEHPELIRVCERSIERLQEQARYLRIEADRWEKLIAGGATSETEKNDTSTKANQAKIAIKEKEAELQYLKSKIRREQMQVAKAELVLAQSIASEYEQQLINSRLVAPFDGIVMRYLKKEGEGISQVFPEPVVLFGDDSSIRVRGEVDERFARQITVGMKSEVYGRNLGDARYHGKVVEVERVMGEKSLFTRSATERMDLHVIQFVIELDGKFTVPIGLKVDIRVSHKDHTSQ